MTTTARIGESRLWLRDRLPLPLFHCLFVAQILLLTNARIYRDFFYFLLLMPFLVALHREDLALLARSWVLRFCFAYLAILWLTLFWGPQASAEQFFRIGRYFAADLVFVALTAWLITRDERHLDRLLAWMAWAALITAVYSMIIFYWSEPFYSPLVTPQWSNPNTGAAIFALVAIAAATGPATRRDWFTWRWAYVAIAVVLVASVVLTGSRASILSLMAAGFACLALIRAWKALAAGIVAGVSLASVIIAGVEDRGLPLLRGGYGGRFEVWSQHWSLAREHLLRGHGLLHDSGTVSGNVVIYDPHNLLLSALFYGGLPAAFLLICLLVALAAACLLYARRTGRIAPFALTVFLVTHGIFESGWLRSGIDYQWLILWLPIGIGAGIELRARCTSEWSLR